MSALVIFTTVYGTVGALSGLFQLQRMYRTASAEDISLRFFLVYFGGYWVWLYYGIVQSDIALIVVDTVGIFISGTTISYAIYLRITEGGQRLLDALFDRSVTSRGI
jgi:uncharacterized protein with PQ loop repeat